MCASLPKQKKTNLAGLPESTVRPVSCKYAMVPELMSFLRFYIVHDAAGLRPSLVPSHDISLIHGRPETRQVVPAEAVAEHHHRTMLSSSSSCPTFCGVVYGDGLVLWIHDIST